MSKQLTSTKDLKRVLGFWDLMAIGVGSIIGSGIMSLTGIGIERTGRSIFIAFIIGGFIALLSRSPQIFLNSVARYRGGDYSMVGTFLGPRWTGTYSMISLLTSVTLAMYALSFADYAMPFLPWLTRKAIALSVLTILFVTNVFGVNAFAKIQGAAVILLVIALTVFTGVGLANLDPNYFEPSTFMPNGLPGLWSAAVLMSYTCDGAQYVTQMSAEAKNPTRDIPRVMLFSTLGIAAFYGLMGVVAAGVLPVDQPAFKRGSRGCAFQAVILSVHDRRRMDGPAHHAEQLHRFLYETVNAGLQRRLVSVLPGKTSSQVQNAHYSAGNLLCDWICADYV